ncbi:RCR1 Protein RCR1 [Candida maltosa Xu316]|uniref:Protein RCR2 n=1 Tax=Candida maltosa (strain Xu316) TaxID=1245528 RepID=M3IV89_CANMX|nr:hypothetical protein G210_2360 [Candida maltosa Xu316]
MPFLNLNGETTLISLGRRDWNDGTYWSNSGGARWAFFAIFVVLVIIVLLGTLRVNKKRARHGLQPVYGTRWMTPPSYRQSQNQYQQPDHRRDPDLPSAYVPTYTATANDQDLGYYDTTGQFHPNPNAKSPIPHPPEVHQVNPRGTEEGNGPSAASNLPSELHDENESDDRSIDNLYRPPPGPPPRTTTTTSTNNNDDDDNDPFSRPQGPPPSSNDIISDNDYALSNPAPSSSSNGESLPSFTEGKNPPKVFEKNSR